MRLLTGNPLAWELDLPGGSAVSIGVFDGVHQGHRLVLRRLVATAAELAATPAVLTFDPHPLEVVAPDAAPKLLTTVEQRVEVLAELGIELVGVLPFVEIRDLTPQAFAREVLADRLVARHVVVGSDFRFGKDREGTAGLLASLGEQLGFSVEPVELLAERDGEVVSSTRIRRLVASGAVEEAAEVMGRPHELRGRVIHGDSRGHSIGYPTANLHIPERMAIPADGVYAAWAMVEGKAWPAVVNIGVRPTFGVSSRTVEAHLLGFSGDLYGSQVALRFVSRLRDERRFGGVDELVEQLQGDVEEGRRRLEETRWQPE
jgi:riboflavin kinase/FMN adenylyltransferase